MYVVDNARVWNLLFEIKRLINNCRGNLATENHFQNVQNIFPHKDCFNLIFNFLLLFRTTHLNFEVSKRGNNSQGHYWLYVSFANSL